MLRSRSRVILMLTLIALPALAHLVPRSTRADEKPPQKPDPKEDVIGLIAPRNGEVIADLGCGTGRWTFELARAVGEHGKVYAVDIDREVLKEVRKRKRAYGIDNVEIITSVADDPRLPVNGLDVVFLNNVIDFVERDALVGFLAGIHAALRDGGRLIIRDPKGGADRVIAECYREGFSLMEAKIPLHSATAQPFTDYWYALRLRKAKRQHAILPRRRSPMRYRTRLHLAEELFRAGVMPREELRATWERIHNREGNFDPNVDEKLDLIKAAEALEVVTPERAQRMRDDLK